MMPLNGTAARDRGAMSAPGAGAGAQRPRTPTPPAPQRNPSPAQRPSAPLTDAQREIWSAVQRGSEASCAFNQSVCLRLAGRLDEKALWRALAIVAARHDALQLRIEADGSHCWALPPRRRVIDWSTLDARAAQAALAGEIARDAGRAFDLESGPPLRATLLRMPGYWVLLLTVHRIACDRSSLDTVIDDWCAAYALLALDQAAELPPAPSFIRHARLSSVLSARRAADGLPGPELPLDRPRPQSAALLSARVSHLIEGPLARAIQRSAEREGLSLDLALLAVFQALLGRLAGHDSFAVHADLAAPPAPTDECAAAVGPAQALTVNLAWDAHTTWRDHLAALRDLVAAARQRCTGQADASLWGETSPVPAARVRFSHASAAQRQRIPGVIVDASFNPPRHAVYDLSLEVTQGSEGLQLDCDYAAELFDGATVACWLQSYSVLLRALVANPGQRLVSAPSLCSAGLQAYFDSALGPELNAPVHCVHRMIQARAQARGLAIAARCGSRVIRYGTLERSANRLAHHLLSRLAGRGGAAPRIGVCLDQPLDFVIAMLAVLKAGGVCVPLDAQLPADVRRAILQDAAAALMVTGGDAAASCAEDGVPIVDLARDARAIAGADDGCPAREAALYAPACLLHVPTADGRPALVEIEQRSLATFLCAMVQRPGLAAGDRLLVTTSMSLPCTGLELLLPLIVGAQLECVDARDAAPPCEGITMIHASPALWQQLLDAGFEAPPRSRLLVGGTELPRSLAERLLATGAEVWVMYGSPESTFWTAAGRLKTPSSLALQPLANARLYVLDAHGQPVGIGISGGLHVAGDGVARGYRVRTELGCGRFACDPFAGGRMFRTAHRARRLPDGGFEVLGPAAE